MPRVLPRSNDNRIAWFAERLNEWAADPGAIGLSALEVAGLAALVQEAEDANRAADLARLNAESATKKQKTALAALMKTGRGLVTKVKAAAHFDVGVYAKARVPQPGPPTHSELPPPTPRDVAAIPDGRGAVQLSWGGSLERVSFFSIWRREPDPAPGEPRFRQIGVVRGLSFTDDDLPRGENELFYFVRAQRQVGRARIASEDSPIIMVTLGRAREIAPAPIRRAA